MGGKNNFDIFAIARKGGGREAGNLNCEKRKYFEFPILVRFKRKWTTGRVVRDIVYGFTIRLPETEIFGQ